MQQKKEKAPCTAATVQDANEHLDRAHVNISTQEIKGQVLELSNKLDFSDVELAEIHFVLQDLVQQLYDEVEPVHNVHSEFSQARFSYYAAALRMVCRSVFDLKSEVSDAAEAAEKLCGEISK